MNWKRGRARVSLAFILGTLLSDCVRAPPVVTLPSWIEWCSGAPRTMKEPTSSGQEGGAYLEIVRPCMQLMRDTSVDAAALVLGVTTSEQGVLKATCVKSVSFDEPEMFDCILNKMWTSGVRLEPNLSQQTYRFTFVWE